MKTEKPKWFYPAQEEIKNYLKEKFDGRYKHEVQAVTPYLVYESYTAWDEHKSGQAQKHYRILFVVKKRPVKTRPEIISVYYAKEEDTMQTFV